MPPDDSRYRTPGQLIQDVIEKEGWTQRVLAMVLGIDETIINKVIAGKRALEASLALQIAEVLEIDARRLMSLQASYELAQAALVLRPNPGLTNRAHLLGKLPVADMIKRGWIDVENPKDVEEVELALTKFFHAASPEEIEILPHAAKRTNVTEEVTPVQLAWLYRVKEIANEMLVPRYSQASVESAVNKLKALRVSAAAARKVPRILAEAGIKFLIVEALPGSKIDGVCVWLDDSPVVALSMRFDRIDNFWFVLRHELEHVLRSHGKSAAIRVDAELEGEPGGTSSDLPEEERIANKAAAEFCVPQADLENFIARKAPIFAERDIIGFSRLAEIHPGLVAGQLQRRMNSYKYFRAHLVKIRAFIAPSAVVDGWGDIAPVGH